MKANVASLQQSRRHSLEVAKTNEAPPKTAAAPRDVDICSPLGRQRRRRNCRAGGCGMPAKWTSLG